MAFAETANLAVKLTLGGNFTSQLGKAQASLKKFDRDASRAYKAGGQIGTGIKRGAVLAAAGVGILVTQIGFGLDQLIQLESLTAQTNAALKSTKGVSGQTADSIRAMAEEFESLNATVDDKVIQSAENLLLTFTNVNKKAFKPTIQAALDMSTALGTDLNSAVKIVGKALSDPAKAAGKLTRAGIILTKSEQKQIAAHVKNNDTLGAQDVILKALNKRYGGSFLAGGNTTAGKVAKFGDAIEDLQKNLATALLPAVSNIADALNELFRDPETIAAVKNLGDKVGKLFSKDNIKTGIKLLKDGFNTLKAIAGPIADVVGAAAKAFADLPPEVKTLLVGGFAVNKLTGGLVTNIFGGIAEAIAKSFIKAPLVNVTGGVVNVGGGVPGVGAAGGAGLGLISKVFLVGEAIGLLALVNEVRTSIADGLTEQAKTIKETSDAQIAHSPSAAELTTALAGVEAGIKQLESDPIGTALLSSGALEQLKQIRANTFKALATANNRNQSGSPDDRNTKNRSGSPTQRDETPKRVDKVTAAVQAHMAREARAIADVKAQAQRTAAAVKDADSTISAKVASAAAAARNAGSAVSAAVRASRPIVTTNVSVSVSGNSVHKVIQVTGRYGQPAGSRNQNNIGVSGAR